MWGHSNWFQHGHKGFGLRWLTQSMSTFVECEKVNAAIVKILNMLQSTK